MVIEGEIATTHLIERILIGCQSYGVCYRKIFLSALKPEDFHQYTIPLFVRCGDPLVEYWVQLLFEAGRPYLYYIDDNFWKIQGDSPLARYYQHPAIRRALEVAVSRAYSVISNSTELGVFLKKFNKNVKLLPPFFDFSLIEDVTIASTEEIRIGFAGSPSRVADLDLLRIVIPKVINSYSNVFFEFAGVMPKGVDQSDRIRFFEHTSNYEDFIKFQAERNWSIGLAPLLDNEANRCKTNNKFREYGACGITGVYSKIEPYVNSVVHGRTGLLVDQSPEAWIAAISRLLDNPTERRKIGEAAFCDVKEKYCVERVSEYWAKHIEEVGQYIESFPSAPIKGVAPRIRFNKIDAHIEAVRVKLLFAYNFGGGGYVIKKVVKRFWSILSNRN